MMACGTLEAVALLRHCGFIRDHTKLLVWQRACALAVDVYRLTKDMPVAERYGLVQQMQRAAVSVASNIAEGASRGSRAEFVRFLNIAAGSSGELDTQAHLAALLGYSDVETVNHVRDEIAEIRRMLVGLRKAIRT